MRIEHTDMAIILLGAFSRYINHLQDEDFGKPETKKILKMLSKAHLSDSVVTSADVL